MTLTANAPALLLRRLLLLLRQLGGLALRFRVVGRLVVGRAGLLRDVAHHRPGLLVGDWQEAVVAVELLHHRRRETEREEGPLDLPRRLRPEVVRIGEGQG